MLVCFTAEAINVVEYCAFERIEVHAPRLCPVLQAIQIILKTQLVG